MFLPINNSKQTSLLYDLILKTELVPHYTTNDFGWKYLALLA